MKPQPDVREFSMTALGVPYVGHQLSVNSLRPSPNPQEPGPQKPGGPYPGICISSASELLDFGFENTEILREKED
ncbi:MAG TPA: hypothetical protein VE242_03585 [Chthoniobacterales bacterium]|nr:hypothetical protein [Chthoniobacterales bacterium]